MIASPFTSVKLSQKTVSKRAFAVIVSSIKPERLLIIRPRPAALYPYAAILRNKAVALTVEILNITFFFPLSATLIIVCRDRAVQRVVGVFFVIFLIDFSEAVNAVFSLKSPSGSVVMDTIGRSL